MKQTITKNTLYIAVRRKSCLCTSNGIAIQFLSCPKSCRFLGWGFGAIVTEVDF